MSANIKMCSLCQGYLKNPRLLPCTHTFCLECLEEHYRGKLPGDRVECPECATVFMIPKKGVTALNVASFGQPTTSEVCSTDQPITPLISGRIYVNNLPHLKTLFDRSTISS